MARLSSASARLRMTNRPACLTSTRKMVTSPSFADTVTVSTISRTSGPRAVEPVCRSRLICGFQLPSTRGPLGDSYEQSFRYTFCSARTAPPSAGISVAGAAPAISFDIARLRLFQHGIQATGRIEGLHLIASADVLITDEYLGHRAAAAARQHFGVRARHRLHVDFLDSDPLGVEDAARARAVRAPVRAVHDDFRCSQGLRSLALRRATGAGYRHARRRARRAA